MILLSQWYEPKDKDRLAELKRARDANESSAIFSECRYIHSRDRQMTYGDFFDYAAEHFEGEVCVLANTDIEFGDTIASMPSICAPMRIIALTRWETPASPRMLGHVVAERFFSGTQDSWGFIGGGVPRLEESIPLGAVGCDQAVLGWAVSHGCQVFDPALDIKTWHVHKSTSRPDRPSANGRYAYPELTGLIGTGLCLCHWWPDKHGKFSYSDWEVVQTCAD